MPKQRSEPAKAPKYPSQNKRCKYCHTVFQTAPTYNGSKMEFCTKEHRWSYRKEGKKPIAAILKKQEKHMRAIAREVCREEIEAAIAKVRALAAPLQTVAAAPIATP